MVMRDGTDSPVRVAIVGGARTPFAKAGTVLRRHSPLDLAVHAVNGLLSLLMAPAVAVPRLLSRTGLTLGDMDLIEVHEAFGGQVACNLKAWEQGWKEPAIGTVDQTKLNQLGSSIAVGHPFSATGARIVTTLANEMRRRDVRYGLVSICAAGAQACAMILERD